MNTEVTRRTVLRTALGTAAAAAAVEGSTAGAQATGPAPSPAPTPNPGASSPVPLTGHGPVKLHWLEGTAPGRLAGGATWGVPWPRGALSPRQKFSLTTEKGTSVPVDSWPTGWWPDGSVKWTAHATAAQAAADSSTLTLAPGSPAPARTRVAVHQSIGHVTVSTGVITVNFARRGETLITSIKRGAAVIAKNGRLVASRQDSADTEDAATIRRESFTGTVTRLIVEQSGPVRAVIRLQGTHTRRGRSWLPFDIRFYLYAGSDGIRMVHSFVWDGRQDKDFLHSLGVSFDVPQTAPLYDRHVRLAGQDGGVLAEAVQPLTGLRRDPGEAVRTAQYEGRAAPAVSTWDTRVSSRLKWIPGWGDFSLTQLDAHGFEIRKRTGKGCTWIRSDAGGRAAGLAYIGSPSGGLALGLRNFWQLNPTELAIAGATTETATATVWLWSPRAQAMDLRSYHGRMGLNTYADQSDALQITYEDYEPGWDSPYGIARTSEMMFWALGSTPTAAAFAQLAAANATPPIPMASPGHIHSAGVFGSWAPTDRSTPARAAIEDHLQSMHDFYRKQVDERSWYGFWDYGDVMHTYDFTRHVWCYDIGGYAWDNSELSTDMWLWYHFLRTGDVNAFRLAEAMTRHTGEVDVYHAGRFKGFGTRHGVLHYSDSGVQARISNAGNRRFYYFLTADERVGDLMHALIDADRTFLAVDPYRKVRTDSYRPTRHALDVNNTTDWGALALAWLTEWERNGDPVARKKLFNSATSIAAMPNGWFQGGTMRYNLDTGAYAVPTDKSVEASSLDAVFGLVELMTELIELMDDDAVRDQWVKYCRLYNATKEEQKAETGVAWSGLALPQAYSRATAYAASQLKDPALAKRAWAEFKAGKGEGYPATMSFDATRLRPPQVLNPVEEAAFYTNRSAQYGLAAIQNLALIGDQLS